MPFLEKSMKILRKHREIKLLTTERGRNYLVSEQTFYTTKFFTEKLLVKKIKRTEILMNKPVYLGVLILKLSNIYMYEFWYGYVKQKYKAIVKLCYMDTDMVYKKTDDNDAKDVETRFDTSIYKLECNSIERPFPKRKKEKVKNKKVIRLMKDESGGKIIRNFVGLRIKTNIYLIHEGSEGQKNKKHKKMCYKKKTQI